MRNGPTGKKIQRVPLLSCLTIGLILLLMPTLALGQAFVAGQEADNAPVPGSASSVAVAYPNAQTAGNLNVVVVGWSNAAYVTGVSDTAGNTYAVAAGTSGVSGANQEIFYAKNIAGGANTVTVNFNTAAGFPDVFVLEYSGASTTGPLDISSGNAGNSGSATTNGATPNQSGDILVVGGTTGGGFSNSGTSFTVRKSTGDGNIVGDQAAAGGSNTVNDSVSPAAPWAFQFAAFSATATVTTTPTLDPTTPITPGDDPDNGGGPIVIKGTGFQAGAVVDLGGASAVNCAVASSTTINCVTPPHAPGSVTLTVTNVDGQSVSAATAFTFDASAPGISGVVPATGITNGGLPITISGNNFVTGATVTFTEAPLAALAATNVVVVNSNTITAVVPALPVGTADVKVINPDSGSGILPGGFTYTLGTGPFNYIQRGDASTGSAAAQVDEQMPNPQGAGNFNVVIAGWNDTAASVTSVTDTEGNTYTAALPTVQGTGLSQAIYYATNLKGDPSGGSNNNTVTVTFSRAATSPDIRILEYKGKAVLDTGAGNFGTNSGTGADTGVCSTTSAVELVVAGATTTTAVPGAGSGFTLVDITGNGDNAEHVITSAIGSCEATAPIQGNGNWVIQSAAFKSNAASFTLKSTPTTQTVAPGSSASYAITATAVNGFSGTITLTCSGLPTGAACNAATVTPGATASTLTITTTSATPQATSHVTVTGTAGAVTATVPITLVVNANATPSFTMAATALSPSSVAKGGTATSTITITGQNGLNPSSVTLSCAVTGGGTPAPTCAFGTIANGTSTLTVSTTAATASLKTSSTGVFYAMFLPIGGLTLLGAGFASRKKKLLGILLLCLMVTGLVFLTACGGSSSSGGGGGGSTGTPSGTYTITVSGTATGATAPSPVPLTLTVQ